MAQIIRRKAATIPPGTAKAAPVNLDISIDPLEVTELHIWVPFGNRGLLGFKIAAAGFQVYPYGADDFIQMEGVWEVWPLEGAINSGAWQIIAYNTGGLAHTIQVIFLGNLPADPAARTAFQPISNAELSSPGSGLPGGLFPGQPDLNLLPPPPLSTL